MKDFVKRMIIEHKELGNKIEKLEAFIGGEALEKVHKIEFANLALQLRAMKDYYDILGIRLENQNVCIDEDGEYYEKVDVEDCLISLVGSKVSSKFDKIIEGNNGKPTNSDNQ